LAVLHILDDRGSGWLQRAMANCKAILATIDGEKVHKVGTRDLVGWVGNDRIDKSGFVGRGKDRGSLDRRGYFNSRYPAFVRRDCKACAVKRLQSSLARAGRCEVFGRFDGDWRHSSFSEDGHTFFLDRTWACPNLDGGGRTKVGTGWKHIERVT
jgi:hypothetical protein